MALALILATLSFSAVSASPTGLLVSFKATPALSVPTSPTFTWIVPPSPLSPNATQAAYRLQVWPALGGGQPWDSGRVPSSASVAVPFTGAPLPSSTPFYWNVTTYLSEGTVSTSAPAAFTTALGASDWAPGASFVWSGNASGVFALLRHEVALPAGQPPVALALLHASARTGDDTILCGFKAYLEGVLVGVGPGRGEAPVWGGDGAFRALPYATYNVTALLPPAGGSFTLAAVGVGAWFSNATRGMLLQLDLHHLDGSVTRIATGSAPFAALHADGYYMPTQPTQKDATAYHPVHEYTDARQEPVGWQLLTFTPPHTWTPANATLPLTAPEAASNLTPKMAAPVEAVPASGTTPATRLRENATTTWWDFGAEFQGGLVLQVSSATAGARLTLVAGESLTADGEVGSTWGYTFTWTLRQGAQVIEQMQYMEFRFVSITVEGGSAALLSNATLLAWRVAQAWDDSASAFVSSSAALNAVYAQSRYTQRAGLLDTYTDSNTRERRVYECDGLIAASARLYVQGDVAWIRHSHSYVLQHPTWPVEWLQMTPLLALQDFWATGSADFALAYMPVLLANTHYHAELDGTGLLNTSHGRHIIDWDPWPTERQYKQSQHFSVTQFFALAGLRALAQLAGAAGNATMAQQLNSSAQALQSAVLSLLLAPAAPAGAAGPLFCDGICSDPRVSGFTSAISSVWALFLGAAAAAGGSAPAAAWARAASGGLEGYGSYGAFMYLSALSSIGPGEGDDGTALLTALTKCDSFSWCGEMERMNATMTRESWTDPTATYSHPWGTSPLIGIARGVMGLQQMAPAWADFAVAPRLGGLAHAQITIPTLRGPIAVQANGTHTVLSAPCGTVAMLCVAPAGGVQGGGSSSSSSSSLQLWLDGEEVTQQAALFPPLHACVRGVGCGAAGKARTLQSVSPG